MEKETKKETTKARTFVVTIEQIEKLGDAEELAAFKKAVEIAPEMRVAQLMALAKGLRNQTKLKI